MALSSKPGDVLLAACKSVARGQADYGDDVNAQLRTLLLEAANRLSLRHQCLSAELAQLKKGAADHIATMNATVSQALGQTGDSSVTLAEPVARLYEGDFVQLHSTLTSLAGAAATWGVETRRRLQDLSQECACVTEPGSYPFNLLERIDSHCRACTDESRRASQAVQDAVSDLCDALMIDIKNFDKSADFHDANPPADDQPVGSKRDRPQFEAPEDTEGALLNRGIDEDGLNQKFQHLPKAPPPSHLLPYLK